MNENENFYSEQNVGQPTPQTEQTTGASNPQMNAQQDTFRQPGVEQAQAGYGQPQGTYQQAQGSYQQAQGSYQQAQGTYQQTQNTYEQPRTAEPKPGKAKVKKERKPIGGFGKVMLGVGTGLAFGVCAGFAFFGVMHLTGFADSLQQTRDAVNNASVAAPVVSDSGNVVLGGSVEKEPAQNSSVIPGSSVLPTNTTDNTDIINDTMKSVVSVTEYYKAANTYSYSYGFFGGSFSGGENTTEYSTSGSGIIVGETDNEYLLVTNAHVVEESDRIEVTLVDDTVVAAYLKGMDVDRDVAVIAVQKSDLTEDTINAIRIAPLGDSDALSLGETVLVIGNAMGYGQSVTQGIISALHREITSSSGVSNQFIQTDAAINPGNSGGAMINLNGEVVGITSSKLKSTSIEGMCFAIPITDVYELIEEMCEMVTKIEVPEDQIGYIGINLQEINASYSYAYGIPMGIYVVSPVEGSPAEMAGLQTGDIITRLDGQSITSYSDLQEILKYYAAGTTVTITYERNVDGTYQEQQVTLTLGSRVTQK